MILRIRTKLMIVISLLMVVVFAMAAFLFINEKRTELADDIYENVLNFGRLTASDIAQDYELYLKQGGFVYFNRNISQFFEQNDDVAAVRVVNFSGELLYDSSEDVEKQYEGEPRQLDDALLKQIKSEHISVLAEDGAIKYLDFSENGMTMYLDENENEVSPFENGTLFGNVVVPAGERYSVIFEISYENLQRRVATMMLRIFYLALFAVMLGMILSFFLSRQVTRPVNKLVVGAEGISKGDFKTRVDIKTRDELSFLGSAFNKMAEDLEQSLEARVYQARVGKELEIAKNIQEQIIPKEIPKVEGIDVAAQVIPATEIGGDVYDFIPQEDGRVLMYLGDVTGHGVPAGIVSSISNALFYAYAGEKDLKKLITNVNRILQSKTMTTMFITLCLMEWNSSDKKFKYVNAGHEKIIHYKAKDGKAILLENQGIALGMIPDVSEKVRVDEVAYEEGDVLVVYSDGVPEAWRNDKDTYGMDRLVANVENVCSRISVAKQIKEAILTNLTEFTAGFEQRDDITLMVIKF